MVVGHIHVLMKPGRTEMTGGVPARPESVCRYKRRDTNRLWEHEKGVYSYVVFCRTRGVPECDLGNKKICPLAPVRSVYTTVILMFICSRSRCSTRLRYIPKSVFCSTGGGVCQGERRRRDRGGRNTIGDSNGMWIRGVAWGSSF